MANEECLILTFGPGIVRYLRGVDLRWASITKIFDEIKNHGTPQIEIPNVLPLIISTSPYDHRLHKFAPHHFECLLTQINYNRQISLITFIAEESRRSPFSSEAYWVFSKYLELSKLNLEEFRLSHIETNSHELRTSYLGSADHEVVNYYVFRKTPFWKIARRSIAEANRVQEQYEEEHRQQGAQEASQRKLTESNYNIFVYVMEDTRNGMFKIGKSKNPEKRERTLQSEVPTTELRLAVPCDETVEAELHECYSTARVRGEWFNIDHKTLFELVTELLRRGDATRVVTEREWLGDLMLRGHGSDESITR